MADEVRKPEACTASDFAAYLADTMDEERRAEFTEYLADKAEARELLLMAYRVMKSEELERDRDKPDRV